MTEWTDEELYSAVLKGPQEVPFRRLYDRHSSPLFRFIYRFTLNSQSAEEILQDIFIQLLSGKFDLRPGANLKSWLYTLAKNKCLNHIKKRSFEIADGSTTEETVSETDLESSFIGKNLLEKLSSVEDRLPSDLLQTWALRKEGWDYQQISKKLSIPVGTVKSRFSRLVEHLKKEFSS